MHGNVCMCYLHFVHLHRWKKVMWEGAVAAFMSIQHGSGMCIKSALHSMARQSYQKSCSDNFFWPSIYTSQLQPGSKALAGALIAALLLGAIWWSHRFWNGSRQRRWFCWWWCWDKALVLSSHRPCRMTLWKSSQVMLRWHWLAGTWGWSVAVMTYVTPVSWTWVPLTGSCCLIAKLFSMHSCGIIGQLDQCCFPF